MKILAVIPARGGSKGIPKKNIFPLKGKPLIEYTIECALDSEACDDIAVSTDSDDIVQVVKKYPQVILIPRPDNISGDDASTEEALLHALQFMRAEYGKEYEAIMTLQATSPLRKPATIKKFREEYERVHIKFDAMLTLHENRADHWVCVNGRYERLYPNASRRRQEREPLYIENSCIYITSAESLKITKSVLGRNVAGFIVSEEEGMDINEPMDIKIIEGLMQET